MQTSGGRAFQAKQLPGPRGGFALAVLEEQLGGSAKGATGARFLSPFRQKGPGFVTGEMGRD